MRSWDTPDRDRWLAVYAAYIADQTSQSIAEGRGPPSAEDMRRFVEEASAVADMEFDATTDLRIAFDRDVAARHTRHRRGQE